MLYMSTYKIKATNLTNNSLAIYGQGDTISLEVIPKIENIRRIKWKFSDGTSSTEKKPHHIFVSKGTAIPGQGLATIKVKIITNNGRTETKLKLEKEICISPNVTCNLEVGLVNPITETSNIVTIKALAQCEEIQAGSPINPKHGYACGGACESECPVMEVINEGIKPHSIIRVKHYGNYTFSTKFKVRCKKSDNLGCIKLYKDNIIGKRSEYKPVYSTFKVSPIESELYITPNIVAPNVARTYKIRNLSESLLPKGTQIQWTFNNPTTGINTYVNNSSYLEHTITNSLPTTLNVNILIPECGQFNVSLIIN